MAERGGGVKHVLQSNMIQAMSFILYILLGSCANGHDTFLIIWSAFPSILGQIKMKQWKG